MIMESVLPTPSRPISATGRSTKAGCSSSFPAVKASAMPDATSNGGWRRAGALVSLWFQPGRAELRPQPLGCVGIISPWNYPIYLALGPLTAAFAAGNRALLRMSGFTPSTAAVFAELAARYFSSDELAVVGGDQPQ